MKNIWDVGEETCISSACAFHSHFIHKHGTSSSWPARRHQILHSQSLKAARQLFCSVLSQLGLVALSSQPSSTPCGDFFLAVTDTGIPLTDCNTISAWLFCFTDVKAPDASKYVLLRQIRQSVLMGLVFEMCQFPETKVQGEKTDGSMSHNRELYGFPPFWWDRKVKWAGGLANCSSGWTRQKTPKQKPLHGNFKEGIIFPNVV